MIPTCASRTVSYNQYVIASSVFYRCCYPSHAHSLHGSPVSVVRPVPGCHWWTRPASPTVCWGCPSSIGHQTKIRHSSCHCSTSTTNYLSSSFPLPYRTWKYFHFLLLFAALWEMHKSRTFIFYSLLTGYKYFNECIQGGETFYIKQTLLGS